MFIPAIPCSVVCFLPNIWSIFFFCQYRIKSTGPWICSVVYSLVQNITNKPAHLPGPWGNLKSILCLPCDFVLSLTFQEYGVMFLQSVQVGWTPSHHSVNNGCKLIMSMMIEFHIFIFLCFILSKCFSPWVCSLLLYPLFPSW